MRAVLRVLVPLTVAASLLTGCSTKESPQASPSTASPTTEPTAPAPPPPVSVLGFAAETQDLLANAQAKLARKGADLIVANDVSHDSGVGPAGVMGGDRNRVVLVSPQGAEAWPEMDKQAVAERLALLIADRLAPGRA